MHLGDEVASNISLLILQMFSAGKAQRQVQCVLWCPWCPGLSHHPSSPSHAMPSWGRMGAGHRGLCSKLSSHALTSPCLLHWTGSPDLPWWKWQHFNICWGARPLDPLMADSLEVNFPVAHQVFFLFSAKQPIQTLPELCWSGRCVTAVKNVSPGALCSCTMNMSFPSWRGQKGTRIWPGVCQAGSLILASLKKRRDLQSFSIRHDLLGHCRVSWKQVSSKVCASMLLIH